MIWLFENRIVPKDVGDDKCQPSLNQVTILSLGWSKPSGDHRTNCQFELMCSQIAAGTHVSPPSRGCCNPAPVDPFLSLSLSHPLCISCVFFPIQATSFHPVCWTSSNKHVRWLNCDALVHAIHSSQKSLLSTLVFPPLCLLGNPPPSQLPLHL